ncbi:hypothetical protein ACFSCX_17645 [Bacillus salitolerans]|uniref:DUF4368 domain-containing protein n=1 Tax=Bacillus salitolerans TaxID=1437434 RepID=A0ABW4LT93_9BACI
MSKIGSIFVKTLLKDLVTCKSCKTFLDCKDQRTTGYNGKKYGRKIYVCPSCKLQIETDQLHLVIDKILNDIRLNNPKQIYEGVSTRIHEEMEVLKNAILELKRGKEMYLDQIEKVKDEIRVRLERQIIEQEKKFLDVLTTYRISINKRIEHVEKQINEKQKRITEQQKVDSNKETWNLILQDAFVDREKIDNVELRNILTNLIEEIKIDKNMSIEYQLRHNLEKQSLSDQLELQF